MIVGMPGCGKNLTVKCIAKEFGVPLLRLDIGRLLGKHVGEIEEAFTGIGDAGGGSVTTRMFGYLRGGSFVFVGQVPRVSNPGLTRM